MSSRNQPVVHSSIRKIAYLSFGLFFLTMGIIGIFVPVWPTTCFLLFAVGCFSKSSQRLHSWMLENRYFGNHLRQYRESGAIDKKILVGSLVSLWFSLTLSIIFVSPPSWVVFLMLAVGAAVTIHLLTLRIAESGARGIPAESMSPDWKSRSRSLGMLGN